MKAVTISQPYASLIASGEKWIENRDWYPKQFRGAIAIHAGKGEQYLARKALKAFPTGCVIAVARLAACLSMGIIRMGRDDHVVKNAGMTIREIRAHPHAEGPYCWILRDIVRLDEPIPAKGAQGLWEFDETLLPEAIRKYWILGKEEPRRHQDTKAKGTADERG